jgi:hypothetical protein
MVAHGAQGALPALQAGEFWYVTETAFEFPEPINDCSDGTLRAEVMAILFMRHIPKHIAYVEDAKRAHDKAFGQLNCAPRRC